MVADRRTHLKYLERKDKTRYNALMKKWNWFKHKTSETRFCAILEYMTVIKIKNKE